MPKWGLTMTQGTFLAWLVGEGDAVAVGDEVVEIDTDKAVAAVESQVAGTLRRKIANEGDVIPVGGVLGILAPGSVTGAEIDAFIAGLPPVQVADGDAGTGGPVSETIQGTRGQLHLIVHGAGEETVVLLHGFGGDALNWRFNIDALAARRKVIAVDLPGHGASTKDVGTGDVDEFGANVIAVLDAKGVGKAHLAGHSLGGLAAARLAATARDRVASLTLIAPAGFGGAINGGFIDGFIAASSRRDVKDALRALFADDRHVTRQLTEDVLRYKRLEGVPQALSVIRDANFPDGRQTVENWSSLETSGIPVLVVWGAQDQVISAEQAARAPLGASVEIIESAGHSPHIEAAGQVNQRLAEFLDDQTRNALAKGTDG